MRELISQLPPKNSYIVGNLFSRIVFKLLGVLSRFRKIRGKRSNDYKKIIVVKLGGVGDAVLATTALKPLRSLYPEAEINIVSWSSSISVFRNNIYVNSTFSSEILDARSIKTFLKSISRKELNRIRCYFKEADLLIFLNRLDSPMGAIKLAMLAFFCENGIKVGLDTDRRGFFLDLKVPDPGYYIKHEVGWIKDIITILDAKAPLQGMETYIEFSKKEVSYINELLEKYSISSFIVIHIGSSQEGWRNLKRIDLDIWKSLIGLLTKNYSKFSIILVGTQAEFEINEALIESLKGHSKDRDIFNFANLTTVNQLAALISKSVLFIGTDSGVAHIASCTETPIITIFSFSDNIGFQPWSKKSFVVKRDLQCSPCIYRKGYQTCVEKTCFDISANDIFKKSAELLKT